MKHYACGDCVVVLRISPEANSEDSFVDEGVIFEIDHSTKRVNVLTRNHGIVRISNYFTYEICLLIKPEVKADLKQFLWHYKSSVTGRYHSLESLTSEDAEFHRIFAEVKSIVEKFSNAAKKEEYKKASILLENIAALSPCVNSALENSPSIQNESYYINLLNIIDNLISEVGNIKFSLPEKRDSFENRT